MAKDLLKFLFGESQVDDEIAGIVESIADMDTDGGADLKVEKKPLASALSDLGIDTKGLENDVRGLSLVFPDGDEYRSAHAILNEPENLHKLAQLGWVFSTQGDVAMTREPSEFRLRFLEIDNVELSKETPKPTKGTAKNSKLSAVIKKGREFATTAPDHDDENPVSHAAPKKGSRDKGVGSEKHGANPEGSPKIGLSKTASHSTPSASGLTQPKEGAHPAGKLKENETAIMHAPGCDCEDCKAKEGVGEAYQPTTGEKCHCKRGQERDNCPDCEGTGMKIDFRQIRQANKDKPGQQSFAEGAHKSGCQCGFCKNKGNIASYKKGGKKTDNPDKPEAEVEESNATELVNAMLEGNPGTPPGITGHKSYPGMGVTSPDRKFRPAKGMVQAKPEGSVVAQQTKPNRSA